jgi:predicted P-loop ATPase
MGRTMKPPLHSLRAIAEALGGDVNGRSALAPGPGHSAGDRSLSVTPDTNAPDGFLVNSFSGDDPIACKDYVRAKLGMPAFTPQAPAGERERAQQPKKTYFDYHDAHGAVVYQVERTDYYDGRKKKFRQRRLDPARPGEWLWKVAGHVQPVLYRLPELIEVAGKGNLIVIVEGERKADLLRGWGIAATCNSGGHGSVKDWAGHAWTFKPGDKVIILPDNDKAGQDHANAVAGYLKQVQVYARILDLPGLGPKGDVIDWADAGATVEQLLALIESDARPWVFSNGHDEAPVIVEGGVEGADEARFRGNTIPLGFIRSDTGQILKGHHQNIRHAIQLLGVSLRHNEFSTQTEVAGLAGFAPPELNDPGAARLRFLIHESFSFLPPKDLFEDVLIDVAHLNRFHPVRDWLGSLVWDGVPRIDNWLIVYGGAENTAFNRAIGRIFLVAGVRRVRQPGCKFDTLLVLESPVEGKNKSQAAEILAMKKHWFTDGLSLDAEPKVVIEQTAGSWIIEFAELTGMHTRDLERIKAFPSRQVDKARAAYGRRAQSIPRQFVGIGTTNDTEYLRKDERRIWPVLIERFDLAKLRRDVEQLWAEAAHYEALGEPITLQEDLWTKAAEVRAERKFENPYQRALTEWFGGQPWVTSNEVWEKLGIARDHRAKEARLVGEALRDLGFGPKQCRRDNDPKGCLRGDRFYEKPKT